jgi:hypothetical protein
METVNVSHNDLFDMLEKAQWSGSERKEDLEASLDNIRDTLRFHPARCRSTDRS